MRNTKRKLTNKTFPTAVLIAVLSIPLFAGSQAQAQTFTDLHEFTGNPDGYVAASIVRDAAGNLYGTTQDGGIVCMAPEIACGIVFKVDSTGQYSVLYEFKGLQDGGFPVVSVPLVLDAAGNLYGTTQGNLGAAVPTVFKLDKSGHETVLHRFDPAIGFPYGPVVRDAQGNLYGVQPYAGNTSCAQGYGCGAIYRLDPRGNFKELHTFNGSDGSEPTGSLVLDPATGSLYGVAYSGGRFKNPNCGYGGILVEEPGCGLVFRIDKKGKYTIVHQFTGHADGAAPIILIRDDTGNLYGIAQFGADSKCQLQNSDGCGTIFEIDATGKFKVLFTYKGPSHFAGYVQLLLRDQAGNLYGEKIFDGANNSGFLFKLTPQGKFEDLFDFTHTPPQGFIPTGLALGPSGTFFGTMALGGDSNGLCTDTDGCGTVFQLTFP
jgi:uncharacterized repeat protein (TIGR03803 family)